MKRELRIEKEANLPPRGPRFRLPSPATIEPEAIARLPLRVAGRDYPENEDDLMVADYFFHFPVRFVESATSFRQHGIPTFKGLPEVAFLGRSNAGKSTLLNAMVNRLNHKIAHNSSKPGSTRTINFYNLKDRLILADMMGYGQNSRQEWGEWMEQYFATRLGGPLKMMFLLLPAYEPLTAHDLSMLESLNRMRVSDVTGTHMHVPFTIVLTQMDRLRSTDHLLRNLQAVYDNVVFASSPPSRTSRASHTGTVNPCQGLVVTSSEPFHLQCDLGLLGTPPLAERYRLIMDDIRLRTRAEVPPASTIRDLGHLSLHSQYLKAQPAGISPSTQPNASVDRHPDALDAATYRYLSGQGASSSSKRAARPSPKAAGKLSSRNAKPPHIAIQKPGISELRWRILQAIDPGTKDDAGRSAFFERWRNRYHGSLSKRSGRGPDGEPGWLEW
ncbi:hypothetical protein RI367_004407 [Sorochytrium milnesiophthora]